MKYLLLASLVLLSACGEKTASKSDKFVLPTELEHCELYRMSDTSVNVIYVVHCPNATTTTHAAGKYSKNITVISG